MNFIESILFLDTKDFINEISKELDLDKDIKAELLKNIMKSNYFVEKKVKNRYLHLMSKNKNRVNIGEIKYRIEL
tara:strand:+ start:4795 stop:5019 length:225 start_codon:yes stop_codon:yes gene_type:complete